MRELHLPEVYTITAATQRPAPWHHEPLFAVMVVLAMIAAGSLWTIFWMVWSVQLDHLAWPLLILAVTYAVGATRLMR